MNDRKVQDIIEENRQVIDKNVQALGRYEVLLICDSNDGLGDLIIGIFENLWGSQRPNIPGQDCLLITKIDLDVVRVFAEDIPSWSRDVFATVSSTLDEGHKCMIVVADKATTIVRCVQPAYYRPGGRPN